MHDPRYANAPLFDRRAEEWSDDGIKNTIIRLFSKIELLDGWKFVSADWSTASKTSKEELKKHVMKNLMIKLQNPKEDIVSYSIQVPELIYGQFFYIGGYVKIPMFQMYDLPIIFRKENLKLRTNTLTVNIDLKKGFNVQLFNKTVPMPLLLATYYKQPEVTTFMEALLDKPEMQAIYDQTVAMYSSTSQAERILQLGQYYSTNNGDQTRKGRGILFSLRMAYEVDIFIQPRFNTNSILFELLYAIHRGSKSDTDVQYKRIRFSEYILAALLKKIYDMILTFKNSVKMKFQIPQTIIFDSCNNKSDIVRYSFPVNPITEIATMLQCSLTGPGGFKKDNVPSYLRDLDSSQFGFICPADTPDRGGCGVTLNMVPVVDINHDGGFGTASDDIVTSFPISLTPFLEHDDQTRLQMASNQAKQSIMLKDSELPDIRSGTESCYGNRTTFLHRAKHDGIVTYIDDTIMLVRYIDNTTDIFHIGYRHIYQGVIDIIRPQIDVDIQFKADEILCSSDFYKKGELALGRNLRCAVGIWEGFNYEDGIVISRSVSESKLTSVHYVDLTFQVDPSYVLLSLEDDEYKPIPTIGDVLKKGTPYGRLKMIDRDESVETINVEPNELCAPIDCTVVGVEIFANQWNKQVKDYDNVIQRLIMEQSSKYNMIKGKLDEYLPSDDASKIMKLHGLGRLDCQNRKGKYTVKNQKINGIMVTIKAIYEEKIGIGDKIANRHGNKGVISLIEEDDNMPVLPDGRRAEIILNPMGIISRINPGQLFEIHTNEILYNFKQELHRLWDKDKSGKLCNEYFDGFFKIIDKTPDRWITTRIKTEFLEWVKIDVHTAIDKLYLIQPPFQSIGPEELNALGEYTKTEFKQSMVHPHGDIPIKNKLTFGSMYFEKLIHRATDKMSARSIGPYSKKTMQPLGGKSRQGGHRLGEMEVWALMAHGADDILNDFLTVQSDSPGRKNELLASTILENPALIDNTDDAGDDKPQSLRLFGACLNILGLELKD